ncbi:uncharacterized protein DFL_003539 [Arthrobotrys flagrans]|uniref:Uncharacterized protein n=1 Tax=Arthrobotrys flagrans TaxID=97331 RepID=A0A437A299_ARTFL|nr:hypothetical protein DFL_003539 [Arthrobotrys flagrans]
MSLINWQLPTFLQTSSPHLNNNHHTFDSRNDLTRSRYCTIISRRTRAGLQMRTPQGEEEDILEANRINYHSNNRFSTTPMDTGDFEGLF